jgi:cytochrome c
MPVNGGVEESFMRRSTFALLATVGAVCSCLFLATAALAQAPAVTIETQDSPQQRFNPGTATVTTGQVVRWEFDQALTTHTVTATSGNWSINETRGPGSGTVEHTFTQPGTYTYHCQLHQNMTGSVTVTAAEDSLENVLVFSRTVGFRHDSIPSGIAAIQTLGQNNDFNVTATEDPAQFTDANLANFDVIVFLSTTGDVLNDAQQGAFERYIRAGGGFAGIHAAADTEYGWDFYNQMIGASFRNHPAGTPTASVDIVDGNEPSTQGLPARWTRTDEWYNYQGPVAPDVDGSAEVADYSARLSNVHVLATLDESTLAEDDGNTADDDHPISWCSDYEGGRIWYTGMGHTQASFSEANFLQHILGGLQTASRNQAADCGEPREAPPVAGDFEKVTLDDDTANPMELDVAPDGRVFYIERDGRVQIWSPVTQQTTTAGTIPVTQSQENGLMGIQLAPNFATTGHVYLAYSQLPDSSNLQVVSRFTMNGNTLDMLSEQRIITWTHQRAECCHSSGSLYFDNAGNLYVSTGDNTNPFASDGFAPIDERAGRQAWDAQRTSGNTNDLNGKILRITPLANASGAPGVGTTYTIPTGNLYAPGTAQTRPEIFGMGFRNPFRFTVDPETNWVLMADYGPDSNATNSPRGPQGSVEFNAIPSAGNYGWPYCIRQNVPYADYNFETGALGPNFNCAAPVNQSPNNTGLTNLPAARPATMWEAYTQTDNRFPALGTGGAPMGGPRYHYDPNNPSSTKFPAFYDDKWFIAEWNNGWIKTATLDGQANAVDVDPFALGTGYLRPMDLDFGPDGSLYVIEWGSGFGGNNADSKIVRIDYTAGDRRPIAHATANPDNGPAPLTVQFSSEGSSDPEGTQLTYAWDFDNNGTTDSTAANPSHTYTNPGAYTAVLRVTDEGGLSAVDNVQVVAGNTRPVVTIEIPENGQFAAFGDKVPYKISVTDAQDGSTGSGINCADVTLNVSLGHDEHAHELSEHTGCEGVVDTLLTSGHGDTSNVFTVLEAVYTDKGATGSVPLTGRSEAILPPKRMQAEFFDATGRVPGTDSGGDPGVQREDTADTGAGQNIGFIEDGDWVSYNPVSLKDIRALNFRVASAGAGGNIEVRLDSPTGQLVGTAAVTPTGGWQTWTNVNLPLTSPPAGTHTLYLVFRHPTDNGGLFNLNWVEAIGKGAATTEAPMVAASANPPTGPAPLTVQFTGTATDADSEPGDELTYLWDFGVAGTTDDTSTAQNPTYTYQRAGTYTATFTATDEDGGKASATTQVVVTAGGSCPQNNLRSDEFDGDALDTNRWDVIRPDGTRPPTVSNGSLHFPIDNGSLYQAGTSARNIVVQDLPDGNWEVTAKITTEPLTQNYQQAGLRLYAGDDNWASVHMIYAGTGRDFEFIYENNGQPRNEAADKLGGIPATDPLTYYVRLAYDGTAVRAYYSYDGNTFNQVGRTADISGWTNTRIGPVALSDQAPTYPVADFDWIRFNPDEPIGGGGGGSIVDNFDGAALGGAWSVVRQDQNMSVGGGTLNLPAQPGDLYGGRNDAKNLVLRDMPAGPWVATAKLNFEGTAQYHQAGLIVYGDDSNFTKFGRIAHTTAGDEKFEFIYENAGTPRNDAQDSTANIPAAFPDDFYVRITSDGTNVTGDYSTDGSAWTPVGRPAPIAANAKIGLFAFSNDGTGNPVAAIDSFTLTGDNVGGGSGGPSYDDQFTGGSLDKTRWNAIVRENAAAYTVAGGNLTITTEPGDIYSADTSPPPNNFILQDASHAGADWVIETKVDSGVDGGYGQGGLLAYVDGDNYVKLDPIADAGQTRINRIELRTEVAGTPTGPASDPQIAAGTGTVYYLRLTKAGNNYTGEFSRDGETWTPAGVVTNPMQSPDFGVFAFGPQAAGQGDQVAFDYFQLDGPDPSEPCECPAGEGGNGDEFDAADGVLNKTKWNHIVREQADLYKVQNGRLEITTVAGDIYTNGDPATTRNFILQTADHAGADWTIETQVNIGQLTNGGYEQGGLLVYKDDDNYIKFDPLSDPGNTDVNRIELRSEVNGVIQTSPADPQVPDGTQNVYLRLTKTGTSYAGEYSYNGETWTALASPVTNAMTEPSFGIYTLGVQNNNHVVPFEYFALDGNRGECEEPEPENQNPQIQTATANPAIGFAPLPVQFNATATDPDAGDTVSYSWDFDNNGTPDSTQQNPTFTYTTPGEKTAKLTVSDGNGGTATRNVTVNVLEADDAEARARVLVFSKTGGFRHDSIDEGHAAIEQLGAANDLQVDHTEDATAFRDDILGHYDTVVFLSTTGDVLGASQQAAFERYIQAGGGYTGIHAAADTEYEWKWYGNLVGAYFLSHPPGTPEADVIVEDADDHTTEHLDGPTWHRTDEWYNYKPVNFEQTGDVDYSPRSSGVHVLLRLDESTYDEQDGNATDDDHPISWCHRYDGGRSWYTGMGHTAASFSEPDYLEHLLGGIEVSAGLAASDGCDLTDPDAPIVEAFAEPTSGSAPLRVEFSSSAIDPNGGPLGRGAYRWEFGDGGSALGASPAHRYLAPGTYNAVLTVTDPEGKQSSVTIPITVHPAGGQAPVVVTAADPTSGEAPLPVRFEAAATDPDGRESRLVYRWDFGDDAGTQFGPVVRHTYMEPGEYEATVTVTDEAGVSTTSEPIEITVEDPPGNVPPTVDAAADPVSGAAPLRVQFSSAATDPDGDQLLISWTFGDGGKGAGERVAHTYTTPGTYDARVTVRDVGGLTATDTVRVTVRAVSGRTVVPPAVQPRDDGDVAGEEATQPLVKVSKRISVARVIRRGLRYLVRCESDCRVSSVLKLKGERLGKSKVRRIAGGHSRKIVVRLDGNVRRNLVAAMREADVRSVRATLVLKVRTADGTKTIRRAVTLRR